jgi:hypothetical protein
MKKSMLYTLVCLCFHLTLFSQETIQKYKGKTYIFDAFEQVQECDVMGGNVSANFTIVLKGSLFTIIRVPDDTHVVVKFLEWGTKESDKRDKYNFTINAITKAKDEKFFLLDKTILDNSCSEYTFQQRWDITFGTLTTPFKFRHDPFLFTTNLNLGTSVSFQKKFYTNWSWGVVAGLSLSSVALDSFSTKGFVMTPTERPAVTPSLSGMIGYKNVNLTIGIGWDFINKTSTLEESWGYHGKRWIGIGLGVSLFNSNGGTPSTTTPEGQK